MQIRFSQDAQTDLKRIRSFLFENYRPGVNKFAKVLHGTLEKLAEQPKMGKQIKSVYSLYKIVVNFGSGSYVIYYRYLNDDLTILSVQHSKEDPKTF